VFLNSFIINDDDSGGGGGLCKFVTTGLHVNEYIYIIWFKVLLILSEVHSTGTKYRT